MSVSKKIHAEENQTLYTYWNHLRRERKAPHRFEIEPSQIANVLPHTFILQHEQVGNYDFRLAGTEICHEFCFELKQNNILEFWTPNDAETIRNILQSVEHEAAIGSIEFVATAKNGQTVDYEMVILPLYHNNMHISRMLGGMVAKDKPYWLGTSRLESFRIKKVRLFWPSESNADVAKHHETVPNHKFSNEVAPLTDMNYRIVTTKDRKFRVYDGGRDNG